MPRSFAQYDARVSLFVLHLAAKLLKVARPIVLLTVFDLDDDTVDRVNVALVVGPPGTIALGLVPLFAQPIDHSCFGCGAFAFVS